MRSSNQNETTEICKQEIMEKNIFDEGEKYIKYDQARHFGKVEKQIDVSIADCCQLTQNADNRINEHAGETVIDSKAFSNISLLRLQMITAGASRFIVSVKVSNRNAYLITVEVVCMMHAL